MKSQFLLGVFLICIFSANSSFAALTYESVNASDLAMEILGDGTTLGMGSATFTESLPTTFTQASKFTGGLSAGLQFDTGIYLTTGKVFDSDDDILNSDLGGPGDPDLKSLVDDLAGTELVVADAAVLEFDFTYGGGDLVFNYIFASEEYNTFVGEGFNDVFGFFIDGVNIALTADQPLVSVDTFNNNTGSFNDNTMGQNPDVLFNGFTTLLTATATGLTKDTTYRAKIAINDVGDGILDSGVFIQSNSFTDGPVPVPLPFSVLFFASGLFGLAGIKRVLKRS